MIDILNATDSELEVEMNRLYDLFEKTKNECYDRFVEMSRIQIEYDAVDKEIKRRNDTK